MLLGGAPTGMLESEVPAMPLQTSLWTEPPVSSTLRFKRDVLVPAGLVSVMMIWCMPAAPEGGVPLSTPFVKVSQPGTPLRLTDAPLLPPTAYEKAPPTRAVASVGLMWEAGASMPALAGYIRSVGMICFGWLGLIQNSRHLEKPPFS